jgi:hypothetical protein
MRLAAGRPYFAPYPGFFQKAHRVDTYVFLDTVQFPRGTTWITRNRFKNDQGTLWLTVPVFKKHLGLQPMDAVRINRTHNWARKHRLSLAAAYAHAPYRDDHLGFLEGVLAGGWECLVDFNLAIIGHLAAALSIDTAMVRQSELEAQGTGDELLVDICRKAGAGTFVAQQEVRKHIDARRFETAGIELEFFTARHPVYPQLWGDFIYNLSTFDLLLNCGPRSRALLLGSSP